MKRPRFAQLTPWLGASAFVLSLLFACHDGGARTPTPAGTGVIIATSDGYVTTGGLANSVCRQQLTPADLEPLTRAVAEAKPATWTPSYVRPSNPDGCCDQFRCSLTLEVQHAEGTPTKYSTFWYSEMSNALPADVRGLFEAAGKIKEDKE